MGGQRHTQKRCRQKEGRAQLQFTNDVLLFKYFNLKSFSTLQVSLVPLMVDSTLLERAALALLKGLAVL